MEDIYIFTGENNFALREKRRAWIQGFLQKHGEENLSRLDGGKIKIRELLDEIAAAPFIAEKRLVVVDGLPKGEKEDVERLATQKHPQVILLFVEAKPDKRLGFTKALLAKANLEEFGPLRGPKLQSWLEQTARSSGTEFSHEALQLLLKLYGEDQQVLSQEIAKLSLYASGRTVTTDDVQVLMITIGEQQVWALMDLIAAGRMPEALAYVDHLLQQGENPVGLWSMFLWMVSNVAPVYAAVEAGISNPGAIAKQAGVPFPSVRSLQPLVKRLSQEQLHSIVSRIAEDDLALKTGGYRSTADESGEVCALIDRAVLSFTSAQAR